MMQMKEKLQVFENITDYLLNILYKMNLMIKYWNYICIVLLFIGFLFIWLNKSCELFVSSYNDILSYSNTEYQQHPVHDTIIADIKSKHKLAYNYEMENNEYRLALKKAFSIKKVCINPAEWNVIEPVNRTIPLNVQIAYTTVLDYITKIVSTSSHLTLPDGKNTPIQVVHDILVSYQYHRTAPSFLMTLQLVMYRESKYHGKDVGMLVKVDKNTVSVLDIWINGVIFEDKIALFPVLPTDPYNTNINMSAADFNDQNPATYIKEGYEFCVTNDVLTEEEQKKCKTAIQFPN